VVATADPSDLSDLSETRNQFAVLTRRFPHPFKIVLSIVIVATWLAVPVPIVVAEPLEDDTASATEELTSTEGEENSEKSEEADDREGDPPAADEEPQKPELHVGGALRINAFYKSWDQENKDLGGDLAFDTFRINVDGGYKGIGVSAEYRFYQGYNMLHHGYFDYVFKDSTALMVGVSQVPFGLLPYASHNWFFNITYYLGLEDDYDLGVKVVLPGKNLNLAFAFYKTDEGSFTGDSIDSARYSYDVVHTDENELGYAGVLGPRTNSEVNQFNGRAAYTLRHGGRSSTELGVSAMYGGLYNSTTTETGRHWAGALHLNGNYGRFNVMLEMLQYGFEPENPVGQDDQFIVKGAYDAPYKVASEGSIYMANVAYTLPINSGPFDSITFYNDFSYLKKRNDAFTDTAQTVLGALVAAGKLYTYIDAAFGKNHPWIGPDYGRALAEGVSDAGWELRFNINIGYYF
jgi:hypothetical protein